MKINQSYFTKNKEWIGSKKKSVYFIKLFENVYNYCKKCLEQNFNRDFRNAIKEMNNSILRKVHKKLTISIVKLCLNDVWFKQ